MSTLSSEFVVFDNGVETDWYDPVTTAQEDDTGWTVNNTYHEYRIEKKPGRTVLIRPRIIHYDDWEVIA